MTDRIIITKKSLELNTYVIYIYIKQTWCIKKKLVFFLINCLFIISFNMGFYEK